jgi:hypothetical protein
MDARIEITLLNGVSVDFIATRYFMERRSGVMILVTKEKGPKPLHHFKVDECSEIKITPEKRSV